jgi:hypothetical protein
MGKMRIAYSSLVGKTEGKRPFGRPRSRWEDNIRVDIREIVWEGVDWIRLAKDRDQCGPCEHSNETSGSLEGGGFLD